MPLRARLSLMRTSLLDWILGAGAHVHWACDAELFGDEGEEVEVEGEAKDVEEQFCVGASAAYGRRRRRHHLFFYWTRGVTQAKAATTFFSFGGVVSMPFQPTSGLMVILPAGCCARRLRPRNSHCVDGGTPGFGPLVRGGAWVALSTDERDGTSLGARGPRAWECAVHAVAGIAGHGEQAWWPRETD
ncbi:hypothetical protein C8J57DRAFT_1222048 [Mycena rebaudengoi]|nr:hypothetical protein C8J57DRAFT_1222048 [Mycena rebaudengoi]